LNLPLFGGLKKTDTGQLPDGWMVLVHPFMSRLKPVPVTLTPGAGRSALLLLVSVIIFAIALGSGGHFAEIYLLR